jgi:hypothetical protein
MTSRHLRSDFEGNLDGQIIADDETCVVPSNMARVAAIYCSNKKVECCAARSKLRLLI